jgi:N,N'-diacetyllegionaminate synthase
MSQTMSDLPRRMIIAEIGSVHDGSFGNACALIDMAASAGAHVVKFQTHIASAETRRDAPMPSFFQGEPRFEYFERTGFSPDRWRQLKDHCQKRGVLFMSSPFSEAAVDLLEGIGADLYKVPSGEVTNVFLLERLAATQKPVILSSGMSSWAELDQAVSILRRCSRLVILQCSSRYPCSAEHVGLNILGEMRHRYGVEIGLSDHTLGCAAAFAAATLGATVIEKHVTFSKLMYGSDACHSMEPQEFRMFCDGLNEVWRMLDHPVDKNDLAPYAEMKNVFEKSLVARRALPAGHALGREDLAAKKPGGGIATANYQKLVGQRLTRAVPADHVFTWADVAS